MQSNQEVPIPKQAPTAVSKFQYIPHQILFFIKQQRPALILLAILLALFWLVKTLFFAPTVISVIGSGEIQVVPGSVEMLVTRIDSNPDPRTAVNQAETSVELILAKAKEIAGDKIEIQKSFYQITPTAIGGDVVYQVVNVIKITANDPSKASNLLKDLYAIGATTVSNVTFIPENQDKHTQEARKLAIKDAREQAKEIARASGKRLGRIVSISDDLTVAGGTLSTNSTPTGDLNVDLEQSSSTITATPNKIDVTKAMTVTYYLW
jgi:uncharacterized protein